MLIFPNAEINLTNIRHYHPEIDFTASSNEKAGKPITAIAQDFHLDITKAYWDEFNEEYERIFLSNGLIEEHALPLLFLISKTNTDIEHLKHTDNEVKEVKANLTFLYEVLKMQEKAKSKLKAPNTEPRLSLKIQSLEESASATLESPAITNFIISKIVEAFKDLSYNYQLASHLQNVEPTSANIKAILDNLNHRKSSIEQQCVADTAYRVLVYLNNHTPFTFKGKYASNEQCRFLFDIFQICNLLKHIIDLKQIPRIKGDLPAYKTRIIKTILKNHKYEPSELLYDSKAE